MRSRMLVVAVMLMSIFTSVACRCRPCVLCGRRLTSTPAPCDLNRDGACDGWDQRKLQKLVGVCRQDKRRFLAAADADGDGCVTDGDVRRIAASGWDLDHDQDIDLNDLGRLAEDQSKAAAKSRSGRNFDFDGDGWITVRDIRQLEGLCTRPHCQSQ